MPALKPTEFYGEITYLGRVARRDESLRSDPLQEVLATWAGVEGEEHSGINRPSCSRVTAQHPRGTTIRNVRQFSIISAEELSEIATKMGVDRVAPEWVGASICLSGLPDLTHLPPSSRLQSETGTTLVIDMENRPCTLPIVEIAREYPEEKARRFKAAANGLRGVTAWVEREGPLRLGEALRLHIPDQRIWSHLEAAR